MIRYVYLQGDIELHYAGDAPASQPPAGQGSRYRLRPTLERRTNSRARLRGARVLTGPYDPAQLQAEHHLHVEILDSVQVELAGQVFRENLRHVYVTNVSLHQVIHQGGSTFGTLRGTGYATLEVVGEADTVPVADVVSPPSFLSRILPARVTSKLANLAGPTTWSGSAVTGTDWLDLARVLRYGFVAWLALGLFGAGGIGLFLVGLLVYFFLSPLLPSWLSLGRVLGIAALLFGGMLFFQHQVGLGVLVGLLASLLFFGGGGGLVGALVGGVRLVSFLVFAAALALFAIGLLHKLPSSVPAAVDDKTEATGEIVSTPPTPTAPSDSLLMSHLRRWEDLTDRRYEGRLAIAQNQFFRARQVREELPDREGQVVSENVPLSTLYNTLAQTDAGHMPHVYALFDSLGRGLDRAQFAQMVVTCVQDIPYALVHQGTCDEFDQMALGLVSQHTRGSCQAGIRFGVQTPSEFMYNLKADCDTRVLFLYTVLQHFGYDAAVLVSTHYSHSVLGLALPASSTHFVERGGQRYYAWETTARGFPLGVLSPQNGDMRYWDVAIR